MPVKTKTPYCYDAVILRENERARRQGTLNSDSAQAAMDTIVELSKNVWKRPLVKVTLYEILAGGESQLAMTSTIGAGHGRDLKPVEDPKPASPKKEENHTDLTNYNYPKTFWPTSIGTYYTSETFAIYKLPDTRG